MRTNLAILVLAVIFLTISFLIHKVLLKAKVFRFILVCIIYFLFDFFLFDMAVSLHQYFRDRKIYFEFGHADEVLVELFLLAIALSVINIAIALIRKITTTKTIK